ncbi:MAG: c-type cytochrome domain-containing protein, partial [Planctomycetota bacterium]
MARSLLAYVLAPLTTATCLLATLGLAQAQQQDIASYSPEQLAFFENKIRPILVEHCYSCHSQDAGAKGKLKGNLLLDSKDGLLRGGDTGPALVANQAAESLILKSLRYEDYEMPPSGKLPANIIEDFERWIADGAADPRRATEPLKQVAMDLQAGRKFWSLQPLARVDPPSD